MPTTTRLCAGLAAFLIILALSPVAESAQEYTANCESARGRLLVPVTLNGFSPYRFALDTCAQAPIIDTAVAAFIQAPNAEQDITITGPQGTTAQTTVAHVHRFEFAGMLAQPSEMGVANLAALSEQLRTRVDGLLPAHQPGFSITIDFTSRTVVWRALEATADNVHPPAALPMLLDVSGAPTISAQIDGGAPVPLQLDSLFPGTMGLPSAALEGMGLRPEDVPHLDTATGPNTRKTQIRLRSIALRKQEIKTPICSVLAETETPRVGLNLLKHFRLTLQYEYGRAWLEPAKDGLMADPPLVGSGLALRRFRQGYWDVGVAMASPAHEAGLQPGDILRAINGRSLEGMSAADLIPLLSSAPGTRMTLRISRSTESGYRNRTIPLATAILLDVPKTTK